MFLEVLVTIAYLGYSVNGQVIGPCLSIAANTSECQNGPKALPAADYGVNIIYSDVKSLFTDRAAIKLACKQANKQLYRAAAVCLANSYRHCADNDFKTLIPTADKYGEAFDYLCNNAETADHILNCLGDSFMDCSANKLAREGYTIPPTDRALQFSNHKEYHCRVEAISEECIRDDIDVQACLDAGTYDKYVELRNFLRPSACGASAIFFTTSLLFVSLVASFFH